MSKAWTRRATDRDSLPTQVARALAAATFRQYAVFYLYLSIACGLAGPFAAYQPRGGLAAAFAAVFIWTTAAFLAAFGAPPLIAPVGILQPLIWGIIATFLLVAEKPYVVPILVAAMALIGLKLFEGRVPTFRGRLRK